MRHLIALNDGLGITIALMTDKYRSGIADEQWIPGIASEKDWVIITQDKGKKPKEKGLTARNNNKLPRLCLEYCVTHILVAQSIARMQVLDKCNAIGFAWSKILLVGNYPQGSRFSLKLSKSRSPLSCGISLTLVEPNKKGNNTIETL